MDADLRRQLIGEGRVGRKTPASGKKGIAVTSHPIVTEVAVDILRSGGNAADAALAASVAQTVVEPHMSTICGALSLLYFDASTKQTSYLNGQMNRPRRLTSFVESEISTGRSVAVPGFWAAFEGAFERFSTMQKKALVAPAIELAREGFEMYPFLYGVSYLFMQNVGRRPEGRNIFFRDGRFIEPGELLRQPALATTLEALLDEGGSYFYHGEFGKRLVQTVKQAGGVLELDDLHEYEARWMQPLTGTYRGFDIVASPPPDSGGLHVIEILNLLEQVPLLEWGPPTDSPDSLYWMMRFCGEVFRDGAHLADPAVRRLPLETILSKAYAASRFELMEMSAPVPATHAPPPGSNHLTVVDKDGNIATVLHSIMSKPWANGLFVDGVQVWGAATHFLRSFPAAGARGNTYVAPTIVFEQGVPVLASGSPSVSLVQNVIQNIVNLLDFNIPIDDSVHRPRFGGLSVAKAPTSDRPHPYYIEADIDEGLIDSVANRGIALDVVNPWNFELGSFEGVHITPDGTRHACADPRRAGKAAAE